MINDILEKVKHDKRNGGVCQTIKLECYEIPPEINIIQEETFEFASMDLESSNKI